MLRPALYVGVRLRRVQAVHGYVETASVIAVLNDADRTSDDIVGVPLYRTQLKVSSTVVQQLHYIHLLNGPFFRDYPGEPVPER